MAAAVTSTQLSDTARLERALLTLAPALEERRVAGLLLRSARGLLPSANSAIPGLLPGGADPETQLRAAEDFFTGVQHPTQWLIGQRPANADLEAYLRRTGYERTQTRDIWCRHRCREDSHTPSGHHVAVRMDSDAARFARGYGRLAMQPEKAILLQAMRLKALAQGGPTALLTVGQPGAAIEGCLIAVVDRAAASSDIGRIGLLGDLLVAPEARRSGLGSQMLAAAENWLGLQGCDWVALEAAVDNPVARNFYRRHGFHIAGQWSFLRLPRSPKTIKPAMT